MKNLLATSALLVLAACTTVPAVGSGIRLAPETRPQCANLCRELGMQLGAVVIVRNSAGCVCEMPRPAEQKPAAAGSAAAASGALIVALEEEEAQRQHDQNQTQTGGPGPQPGR